MSRTARWSGVTVLIVLGVLCFVWRSGNPPLTARQQFARDAMTFPSEPTPEFEDRLSLSINGIDWMSEVPTVESGTVVKIIGNWDSPRNFRHMNELIIAPRLEPDPDFSWMDLRTDKLMNVDSRPNEAMQFTMSLEPGNYVVRLYLRTFIDDEQLETSAAVDLIAVRRLVVTPSSKRASPSVRPGETPKRRMPMAVARWGTRDPRRE